MKKDTTDSKWFRFGANVILGLVTIFVFMTLIDGSQARAIETGLIVSASEIDYPPFCIVDSNGRASGFSVELMQAALSTMGQSVTFRTGPWNDVKGWLEKGEIQALPLVGRTPEREAVFDFTFPYMSIYGAIVVRADTTNIQDLSDLKGRTVAVMKDDNAEEFLRRQDRGIRIHITATFDEALRELSDGRHDAVVIQRLVALRLIQETGLKNLKVVNKPIEGYRQDFCFAVREGDRKTLELLNEGLALVMADGTYRHLHAKWFAALELPSNRRIVVGGDHSYPPYEYLDEKGHPAGYNVDLTRAIAKELDLDIEIRLGPWTDIITSLEKGEIDIIQGMLYSIERDLKFDFTPPHTMNHCVGIVRQGEGPPPSTPEELADKRIVVQGGDIMHDFAIANGLGNRITSVDSQEKALLELSEGKHDCALVSRMTALYWIEKHGWKNLTVARRPLVSPEYCYAVPNGHKALLTTFSEGLNILEANGEYRRIHEKWLGVHDADSLQMATILRYVALVAGPLLLVLLGFFLWSWTLRKQVASQTEELRQSAARFRDVFESANVGKSITFPTGEIHINQAFAIFLGYDREELQGKTWQTITPADDIETIQSRIEPLLSGRQNAARFEKRYLHKDGTCVWGDVSTTIRRTDGGQPLYFVTTVVDITAKKQVEFTLHENEAFQHAIIACSPVALYSINLNGTVLSWNPSAEKIFGWTADEAVGKHLPIVPEDKQDEFSELRRQIAQDRGFVGKELIRRRKDGMCIHISLSVAPIRDEKGKTVGIMSAAEDITERKRAEEEREKLQAQLLQAQKMEAVGRLAGGVAHDFNNMLNVIIGYTELALGQLKPDDAIAGNLEEVLSAAGRSADITRQLLAFARKQTVAPRVLDLNETVEGMLKMLRRLIGEDIDLSWKPGSGLGAVNMDPSQIDQILANLCVNARDAIAGVGRLTIETANVHFDQAYCADHAGFVPGKYVMLAVSDDGCGMDKETLKNLFEPFFTTKEVGQGTGLGLATVYGIVKQNEGFIYVYSEPGQGTIFRIYLQRYAGIVDGPEIQAKENIIPGNGETVLLVEDEASVLRLASIILEGLGYTVMAAANPAEGERLAEAHAGQIDLLITDVVMPTMNGRELSGRLHARYPGIKTLFMSGYTANVIAHHGVLDKGVHFIQKPFSREGLATKVREALEG